jgi:hypothetical protein
MYLGRRASLSHPISRGLRILIEGDLHHDEDEHPVELAEPVRDVEPFSSGSWPLHHSYHRAYRLVTANLSLSALVRNLEQVSWTKYPCSIT